MPKKLPRFPAVSVVDVDAYSDSDNQVDLRLKISEKSFNAPLTISVEWGSERPPVVGARYLCRIERHGRVPTKASPIRKLSVSERQLLVVAEYVSGGFVYHPVDKSVKRNFIGGRGLVSGGVSDKDLLAVKVGGGRVYEILQNYGRVEGVGGINMISLRQYDIVEEFPQAVLDSAASCSDESGIVLSDGREDLRDLPLVTIDGEDAKDFDDAVFVCGDGDGFRVVVGIADVASYVEEASCLDLEARRRGNSIYLAGMVVPMLPFALSAGVCSLQANKDRFCLVADMRVSGVGEITSYRFYRGLMRSRARLIYEDIDAFLAGSEDNVVAGSQSREVLANIDFLHRFYRVMADVRCKRGALAIESAERKVELGADGSIAGLSFVKQSTSRKIIEELMIAANICAAQFLQKHNLGALHRNHEVPPMDKVEMFREMMLAMGYQFPSGSAKAQNFNLVAEEAGKRGERAIIEGFILRSQSQAYYAPDKKGHFGLGLKDYCHFTSPIRRYADLLVHRAIVARLLGEKATLSRLDLVAIGESVSDTERTAMGIERSAADRISALYLKQLQAAGRERNMTLSAVVRSITDFAVFVYLEKIGGDALLPFSGLPRDYYRVLDSHSRLLGCDSGLSLRLGDKLEVLVDEVDVAAGRIAVRYSEGGKVLNRKELNMLLGRAGKPSKPSSHKYGRHKHARRGKPRR